ncbi:MAG: ABC transporter ATP-binding protein, partial [Desulfuromusa sp.]|nr:ABC transporter ATP-binding protein [Desulfuromusa sp.]
MAEVILQNISKSFGSQVALADISLTIPDGSFVVLLGPTGAGKTTTLRMVSGLDKPDSGTILIDGIDAVAQSPAQRNVAM